MLTYQGNIKDCRDFKHNAGEDQLQLTVLSLSHHISSEPAKSPALRPQLHCRKAALGVATLKETVYLFWLKNPWVTFPPQRFTTNPRMACDLQLASFTSLLAALLCVLGSTVCAA